MFSIVNGPVPEAVPPPMSTRRRRPSRGHTAASLAVLVQEGHAAEGSRAGGALVLLHLGVGLQVGAQVGAISEGTAAVRAGKRSLAGVRADVSLQQPGSGEGLPAGGADAGQGVGADVHLQGTQAAVLLGAVLAAEGTGVGYPLPALAVG